jgi:hypothetical protein
MTPARQARATRLFAIVTSQSGPWTIYDLAAALGNSVWSTKQAVHDLRIICGFMYDVTLTCEPNGKNQPWLYELIGRPSAGEWWTANRVIDLYSRVETVRAVIEAEMRGVSPRTTEHRAAKVFLTALDNVQHTLDALTP